jgi:predicted AAA+ superfamily ATPase
LQANGLVYLLEPYFNNLNKRMTKTPKLYFLDTGLACFLLKWQTPMQMYEGAMWGQIFETYVVGEIIKSYYNDGQTSLPLYYYRDKEKNEIDLIIEEAGTLYPIEIKASSDPNSGMISAFDVLKKTTDKKIGEGAIICTAKDVLPLAGGNWIIPVDKI